MKRAEKLRSLHGQSPDEDSYEVNVPRKILWVSSSSDRFYVTVYDKGDYWFVLLTNQKDSHNRAGGSRAYAVDFRKDDGEVHERFSHSGAWKSALTVWPVMEEDEAKRIVDYVARMVDLAHEQHIRA